jgi:exopolysaccharide biosynthesis polyprenyl glycosylphosphotransferase
MFLIIRLISDISLILISYVIAYSLRFNISIFESFLQISLQYYVNYLVYIVLIYLFSFYLLRMYKSRKGFLVEIDEFIGTLFSVTFAWAILIVLTYVQGEYEYSRPIILLSWPISILLILFTRQIILRIELYLRSRGYGNKRVAIIGTDTLARSVAKRIKEHPSYGINFIGFIGDPDEDIDVIGKFKNLERIIENYRIQLLYVADKSFTREKLTKLAEFCAQKGVSLGTIPDVFEILTTSPAVEEIEGLPMVTLKETRFTSVNRFIKRTFDIVLSIFGIVIFSLPMAIISILIQLTSPGASIIYKQERVGRRGKVFDLYKFRTMIPNAEKKTGAVLATEDDPRKTPFGRFLRATKLDELPQLFNILKGDMSFVGPRPERPVFVEEYKQFIPKYMVRHNIRPGLAGWAQMQGAYDMPAEEKIKYDLYYIENWSFLLDVKIIVKCVQIAATFQRRN